MSDSEASYSKCYNYLEVNNGRYLCNLHGSFFGDLDQHSKGCPICCASKDTVGKWEFNPVDRGLNVVRNLQRRSRDILKMETGVLGFLGASAFAKKAFLEADLKLLLSSDLQMKLGGIAAIALLLSMIMYILSLGSVNPTKWCNIKPWGSHGGFHKKKLAEWEKFIARKLFRLELYHLGGATGLLVGVLAVAIAIASPYSPMISRVISCLLGVQS